MNAILARELAIQMRAGASLDDAIDFARQFQQPKGGVATTELHAKDPTIWTGSRPENVRRLPISRGGRHA